MKTYYQGITIDIKQYYNLHLQGFNRKKQVSHVIVNKNTYSANIVIWVKKSSVNSTLSTTIFKTDTINITGSIAK